MNCENSQHNHDTTQKGIQQGIQRQILEGIQLGLELKFGAEGLALMAEIREIDDLEVLKAVHEGIWTADKVEALRRLYRSAADPH